jgi:hypothetical protein
LGEGGFKVNDSDWEDDFWYISLARAAALRAALSVAGALTLALSDSSVTIVKAV